MPRASHLLPYAALAVAVAALLAGCGHSSAVPSTPASAARSTPASAAPTWFVSGATTAAEPSAAGAAPPGVEPSGAPPGTRTCAELGDAFRKASLMQPGVVDGVLQASVTAEAPVADAAQRLASAYATAVAAKGSEGEPDAVAAVSAAAANMEGLCEQGGLATTG